SRKKATSSPTFQPNASLSSLGTVTCPFTVMVLVFMGRQYYFSGLTRSIATPTWVRSGARSRFCVWTASRSTLSTRSPARWHSTRSSQRERPAGQAGTPGGRGAPDDRRRRRVRDRRAVLRVPRRAPGRGARRAVRLRLRAVPGPPAVPDAGPLGARQAARQPRVPRRRYAVRGGAERRDVASSRPSPGALPRRPGARRLGGAQLLRGPAARCRRHGGRPPRHPPRPAHAGLVAASCRDTPLR